MGHVASMGEVKSAYKMLFEKPERRRKLGKPRNILEDNSKRVLKEVEFELWIGFMWLGIRDL